MGLPTFTLAQLVQTIAQAYSAAANRPARTDKGSSLGALINAVSLLFLGLQNGPIRYATNVSRVQTSLSTTPGVNSPDVDSFWQQFGIPREGNKAADGPVVFSTPSPVTQTLVVPVGATVQTPTGVQYSVIADATNAAYSAALNGYPIQPNSSSVTATVLCVVDGSIGNAEIGEISQLFGAIAGVSSVTNTVAFTTGADTENDVQYNNRAVALVSSGRVGTPAAIAAAVLGVQSGLTYSVAEGVDSEGDAAPGTVTVVVNTQSAQGTPTSAFLALVSAAVQAVRPAGITVNVVGPVAQTVGVLATLKLASGANFGTVSAAAIAAVQAYISGIGLDPAGKPTIASYIGCGAAIIAVPGVVDVTNLQLNGGTTDVSAPFATQLVPGTITFVPG